MSSLETARVNIETTVAGWTTLPVYWTHDRPNPPPDYVGPWVSGHVGWGSNPIRLTLGGTALLVGVLDLVIHVRPGTGMSDVMTWTDELRDMLSDTVAGVVRFGLASAPISDPSDERWQKHRVSVSFDTLEE